MRPGQGQRRGGRRNDNRHGGGNGGGHRNHQGQGGQGQGQRSAASLRNQIFDSNGPDMRVRGNAFQVHEKYQALAKDALSSGDRVLAENYLQHAEHYYRIIEAINEATAAEQRARQASWESQPQPNQYHDGQPQGGEQGQDGQPSQDGAFANGQDGQQQGQNGHGQNGQGQQGHDQNFRRQNGGRDGQRDHRNHQRDGRDFGNRNQQRYGNPDNRGNEVGYDQQQGQRGAEYQPHNQTQQPSGNSQDPLYDGVDEDVNDSPDTQAAVAGRR